MPEVSVDNNPSITDTVLFTLYTPDENGCFLKMPYKVNKIIIYFVERNFSSGKTSEYTDVIYDVKKLAAAEAADALGLAALSPLEAASLDAGAPLRAPGFVDFLRGSVTSPRILSFLRWRISSPAALASCLIFFFS